MDVAYIAEGDPPSRLVKNRFIINARITWQMASTVLMLQRFTVLLEFLGQPGSSRYFMSAGVTARGFVLAAS